MREKRGQRGEGKGGEGEREGKEKEKKGKEIYLMVNVRSRTIFSTLVCQQLEYFVPFMSATF